MSDLISVLYISRATFEPLPSAKGIEPHVGQILRASRTNNGELNIGGVLFYGDGYFFQCLEGEESAVRQLMEVIKQDERHQDVKIIVERPISERYFGNWSMKYTSINHAVKEFLRKQGFNKFNPYKFTNDHFKGLIRTLREVNDMHVTADSDASASQSEPALSTQARGAVKQPGNRPTAPKKLHRNSYTRAFAISGAIVGLAVLAMFLV